MTEFETLNGQIVFTRVKSKDEALELRSVAREIIGTGKSTVIFFADQYHLQLAPGQDPYQVRKTIDEWIHSQEKSTKTGEKKDLKSSTKSSTSKKTPLK